MAEDSEEKLEKRLGRREFLKFLGIWGAALLGINCVSEEGYVFSNFPAPKVLEQRTYLEHRKDPDFSDDFLYQTIGFDGKAIGAKKKIGRQIIARLKSNCGNKNHGDYCITDCIPGIPPFYEGVVQATVVNKTLYYILEGDNKSFTDISYDPNTNELVSRQWAVEDGVVKSPLPRDYKPSRGIRYNFKRDWGSLLKLHYFLKCHFDASIFSEKDVKEAMSHKK